MDYVAHTLPSQPYSAILAGGLGVVAIMILDWALGHIDVAEVFTDGSIKVKADQSVLPTTLSPPSPPNSDQSASTSRTSLQTRKLKSALLITLALAGSLGCPSAS